ncbi:MAG: hypothetical protein NC039_08850 [Muribaculaceae bacterium]|nr:hypothetical protein [Muribaculaceae bacterium]
MVEPLQIRIQSVKSPVEKLRRWIGGIVNYIYANANAIFLAFVWTCFLVFFTYTTLLVEAVKVEGDFYGLFYKSQSEYVALFVNIGIIVMLLFDNHAANKRFEGVAYYIPIVAIALCVFIMAHSSMSINNELAFYRWPICEKELSFRIYLVFTFIIFSLKVRALSDTIPQKKSVR